MHPRYAALANTQALTTNHLTAVNFLPFILSTLAVRSFGLLIMKAEQTILSPDLVEIINTYKKTARQRALRHSPAKEEMFIRYILVRFFRGHFFKYVFKP